jgi:ADP-ribose pyrophosphatase
MTQILRCAIALGSNLGDSQIIFDQALHRLHQMPEIRVEQRSPWYRTKPVGPPQPDYLNGCALLQTTLSPRMLMQRLLQVEAEFGRVRGEKNGPRTLDLDFLWADDQTIESPELQLPHPRLAERAFVLVPLAAIAPDWIHPILGKAIADLLQTVDCSDVQPHPALPPMPLGRELPQLLKQRFIFKGRKFNFESSRLRLPNQNEGEWECIRHPGGALAVPVTPDGQLVLVKQYRFAVQGRVLEFPAGTVEPNETPEATIEREIQEETGYRAQQWQKLGEFFIAPGYSDEIIYAFLAKDLELLENPPQQDQDEEIEVVVMTADAVEKAIHAGDIADAKTVTSFMLARPFLG